MNALQFKTNIKCSGCVAQVSPVLNQQVGENNWRVNLQAPERTLTVRGDFSAQEIVSALNQAGYEARPL